MELNDFIDYLLSIRQIDNFEFDVAASSLAKSANQAKFASQKYLVQSAICTIMFAMFMGIAHFAWLKIFKEEKVVRMDKSEKQKLMSNMRFQKAIKHY